MTSDDDSWALPEARDAESAAAAAAAIPSPHAAPQGTAPYGAFSFTNAGTGAGFEAATIQIPPRTGTGALLWAAFALLGASAVIRAAVLFTHVGLSPAEYEFLSTAVKEGYIALVTLVCAALLVIQRTRTLARGLVLALGLLFLARDFSVVRPSLLNPAEGRMANRLLAASFCLVVLGGAAVFADLLRQRRPPRDPQSAANRVSAVLIGVVGAVVWFIGELLAWLHVTEFVGALHARSAQCCSWGQVTPWSRAYMIASGIAVLLLALVVATARSRTLALGLMIGTVLLIMDEVVAAVVEFLAPTASTLGLNHVEVNPQAPLTLTITPLAGFWAAMAGLAMLAAAGTLRYALAPRRAPFPEFPPVPPVG